jgi:hypothetical protein
VSSNHRTCRCHVVGHPNVCFSEKTKAEKTGESFSVTDLPVCAVDALRKSSSLKRVNCGNCSCTGVAPNLDLGQKGGGQFPFYHQTCVGYLVHLVEKSVIDRRVSKPIRLAANFPHDCHGARTKAQRDPSSAVAYPLH